MTTRNNRSEFSEEVLTSTLSAVRSERRRREVLRYGAAAVVLLVVGLAWWRPGSDTPVMVVDHPVTEEPAPTADDKRPLIHLFTTSELVSEVPIIRTVSTKDVAPLVRRVSDKELAEVLADRPHATYMTADGQTRVWVPKS